ncbi:MAG: hypothetical protein JWM27_2947 [Gemmatimonadetes bacterium]|nr:hypothetical protein [Gemmatimonadota bacterium]
MAEEGGSRAHPEALLSARALAVRVRQDFRAFVADAAYPCLGARAALRRGAYRFTTLGPLGSADATAGLAQALAEFAADPASGGDYATFVAAFLDTAPGSEAEFEDRLWRQLADLSAADPSAGWDPAVSDDPDNPHFSFSFAGTAFFVVGLHPESSRMARRFGWPALVFNPHEQFARMRAEGLYARFRDAVRAREMALQGSLNPNLGDFGQASDARQYSGRAVEPGWKCPFHRSRP